MGLMLARAMLNRACEVRGIDPQDIADTVRIHCGGLPSVASDADLQVLKCDVSEFGADVTILDPLYLANEGKIVAIVPPDEAGAALAAMQAHPFGKGAAAIGEIRAGEPGRVTMKTVFGGTRIVDMLVGEQLPRIC